MLEGDLGSHDYASWEVDNKSIFHLFLDIPATLLACEKHDCKNRNGIFNKECKSNLTRVSLLGDSYEDKDDQIN